ncbi:Geranylgeranyl pyrophosphate synthase [Rubrobacter radiotolerans]|uniref:Geranylgeranyl pyrophosphate synthase n=1 Tax=Rubrobacter radiotolerans TaxID=42256 RepID=A0A023X3U9_RUBRA|nr:polyprenyl synthetase family protein [Rubrobacter radiotolerans]AHY47033.1 Geranylgeranyl pyrophosphate synthase [Rubrobacter radiotolerans]MDX5894439.1 polyprenyl synthetase family protein [Rubrobacter radiotolerans]SMC06004.1 octaprenyl-diphosphate synthase [Rubrobacter radiotolerans DSM 5868]
MSEVSEPRESGGLLAALPEWTSDALEEVEAGLVGVAERAPERLRGPAMEALTSGGKRLRPLLLLLAGGMGAPDRGRLLEAAVAIEVLHTATLIHDDIVDRAEMRRGVPTAVAKYGRPVAVATGDYLFAETFRALAGIGDPRLIRSFAEASEGLASGELTQYRANGVVVDVEAYLEHIKLKTAGLFKVACVAGGTLGGMTIRQVDALANYGQALGIAFQMSDDIMDLVGKPGLMGKGIGTDLVEGTVTLPVIFALKDGDAETIRRVLEDRNPSAEALEAGIEAVLATDAIKKTEAWADREIGSALRDLALLPASSEREFLRMVAREVVGREV